MDRIGEITSDAQFIYGAYRELMTATEVNLAAVQIALAPLLTRIRDLEAQLERVLNADTGDYYDIPLKVRDLGTVQAALQDNRESESPPNFDPANFATLQKHENGGKENATKESQGGPEGQAHQSR